MITEISGTGFNQSIAIPSITKLGRDDLGYRPVTAVSSSSASPAEESIRLTGVFARLSGRQDELTAAARVVREVGSVMEYAGQLLEKLEEKLGEIVKMYPPYPLDSPERISLLNDINGLRKQVDALTFPPEKEVAYFSNLVGAGRNGNENEVGIHGDDVNNTKLDENIFGLLKEWSNEQVLQPSSASDDEVGKAFDQARDLKASLIEFKDKLWQDVIGYVDQVDSFEAERKALDFRRQIADVGVFGIGSNAQQLVQVAGFDKSK